MRAKAAVSLALILSVLGVAWASGFEEELSSRRSVLFVEGQELDGLVLGARARMDLVKLDADFVSRWAERLKEFPELDWASSEVFGKRGKALVLVKLLTYKPFPFEPERFSVDGRPAERILWPMGLKPPAEIASRQELVLGLVVDLPKGKRAQELKVAYGEYAEREQRGVR